MDKRSKSQIVKVVIVGGGFAGINAYLELAKAFKKEQGRVQITLVNEQDHFLFVPLIHEVVGGNLFPYDVRQPLRQVTDARVVKLMEGCATLVDADKKEVTVQIKKNHIQRRPKPMRLRYDYLVLAGGSQTEYYGIEGAQEYGLPLKNLYDAANVKNAVIDVFAQASGKSPEEQSNLLRFVIVGGGASGVEIAGELADLMNTELRQGFDFNQQCCEIVLIEGGSHLLGGMPEWFHRKAVDNLMKKGHIRILLNRFVTRVTDRGVQAGKEFIEASAVIWVAGVRARPLEIRSERKIERDPKDRIRVTNHLTLPEYENIFVAGDQAWILDKENEKSYPMRAQFAVREGRTAGRNIIRLIRGKKMHQFAWSEKGIIVSLGQGGGLASVLGIRWSGLFAWVIYRVAYLFNLVGKKAKLKTAWDWSLHTFLPRDISKL